MSRQYDNYGRDQYNIEKIDTLNIVNDTDRNVLLDDWKPSFEHMQGRKEAIAELNIALADPKKSIACIVGLGGYGKSTLAAKLFDGWSKEKRFWADLSQRSRDFREFATRAIAQLGQKSLEQVNNLPEAQLGYELAAVLQGQGFLVVLDNLESLLNGDGNLESVLWREFLEDWANDGEGSKVLITTREEPNLPKLRFSRYELCDGLEDAKGAAVLRDFGLLGTEAELVVVSQRVGGIPLSLMLIVGLLRNDYEEEPHVRFLPKDLFGIEGAHRLGRVTTEAVFRASFERLESRLQSLLMAVSVFAKPFDRTMAAAMIADEKVTDRDLLLLKKRGFVLAESGSYRFQPQIQELVQRQAVDLPELHRHAINFYLTLCEAKPTLDPRYDTLEDADPYLQVFHHYCELGEFENAFYVLRSDTNDIDDFLTLCGYYAKLVDMYTCLVNAWKQEKQILKQWKYAASLTSLGNGYFFLGKFQEACTFYQESLEIAQKIGSKQGELVSFYSLGNIYRSLGQYQEAIRYYQQSLKISLILESKKDEANSLCNLGNIYRSLGQYQEAIRCYQQSFKISQVLGDKQGESVSIGNWGLACHCLGQYQKAIDFYQQQLEISESIGDKQGKANSLCNLGSAFHFLGQYNKSIDLCQQSLKIQKDIGNRQGEATSLMNLGITYHALGQYQKSINFHQESLEISRGNGDRQGEAASYGNLGLVYYSLGQYDESLASHKQQLKIARDIGDKQSEAASLNNSGLICYSLRQYDEARSFFHDSLEISQDIGDKQGEANSLRNLGLVCYFLGQYQKSIIFQQQSLKITQETGNKQGEAAALNNLGTVYNSIGHYPKAIVSYQQSLEIKHILDNKRGEADLLISLANVYLQVGKVKEGFEASYRANLILQELELPLEARPYPKCFKTIIRFAQRGKWQIALCFCIGLFAFPLFLAYLVALLLWRLIKEKVKR